MAKCWTYKGWGAEYKWNGQLREEGYIDSGKYQGVLLRCTEIIINVAEDCQRSMSRELRLEMQIPFTRLWLA